MGRKSFTLGILLAFIAFTMLCAYFPPRLTDDSGVTQTIPFAEEEEQHGSSSKPKTSPLVEDFIAHEGSFMFSKLYGAGFETDLDLLYSSHYKNIVSPPPEIPSFRFIL